MLDALFDPRTGESWVDDAAEKELRSPRSRAETRASIDERFLRFHDEHPEVYDLLLSLTRRARSLGRRHIAIEMLWQVLRWSSLVDGLDDPVEKYKLNDHYRSRYARLIMSENPELDGIFRTRALRSVTTTT